MPFQEPELMFSIAFWNKSGTNAFLRQIEIPDFFSLSAFITVKYMLPSLL